MGRAFGEGKIFLSGGSVMEAVVPILPLVASESWDADMSAMAEARAVWTMRSAVPFVVLELVTVVDTRLPWAAKN